MTGPGSTPPPAPGWWVKRNRVEFPPLCALTLTGSAPTLRSGSRAVPSGASLALTGSAPTITIGSLTTLTPGGASLTLTGSAPTITIASPTVVTPGGATLTLTGSAPTVTVAFPLTIIGTPAAAHAASITLPTHAVGDLIVLFAYRGDSNTTPTKPSAGGTVPAYVDIDNNTGANTCSSRSAYFVATATNHTSGTWTNAHEMAAIVIRGQNASPIGGHAESGGSAIGSATAPSITLTNSSGSSMILEFYGAGGENFSDNFIGWNTAPGSYTRRASVETSSSGGAVVNTKDTTTSDGSIAQTFNNSGLASRYRGNTIEILD